MLLSSPAANAATVLDPTVQVLLTVFGAALVTALAGFGGAWLQGRREHARWIRERRYDAYVGAMRVAERWRDIQGQGDKIMASDDWNSSDTEKNRSAIAELEAHVEVVKNLTDEIIDVSAPLELLGPTSVLDAFNAMTDAYSADDERVSTAASEVFITEMRKTLKIEK